MSRGYPLGNKKERILEEKEMKKVTRNDINKENTIALSYCQCQAVLAMFGGEYKIGYNAGVYGWNYDLYEVNGVSIVTGYHVPYYKYNNQELKKKLIALDNKVQRLNFLETSKKFNELKKEFLEIFE